nr:XTP/dITP diphosphohydrolase [Candidatus Cloacimonadota bacterium]
MIPLLLSTRNPDKVKELCDLLAPLEVAVHSLEAFPECPETIEDKDTIFGNAIKKACNGAAYSGMLCLADDTGLFIDALGGDPGVYSARWAGPDCSYQDNRRKVLLQLEGISDRRAYFRTAMALVDVSGLISVVQGEVAGFITEIERGNAGFGYDSIFEVEGIGKTFAEMSDTDKNRISHRGLALNKIIPILERIKGF